MNAILLAIGAGLCWGIGEVFTKSVLHTGKVGPLTAIAVRSTVALPILWLVYSMLVSGRKLEPTNWLQSGSPTLLKLICGSGLIAGAAGMICFYAALNLGEISRIKPIAFSIAPAVAVLLGWLVLREEMTLQKGLGVLLILGGVILLTGGGAHPAGKPAG
jgi:transporter family protein